MYFSPVLHLEPGVSVHASLHGDINDKRKRENK